MKNSYLFSTFCHFLFVPYSTAAFSSELFALLSDLHGKKKLITTNDCIKSNV